jgi:hypothetical protein
MDAEQMSEKHEHLLYRVIALREKQIKDLEARISELELLLREAIEISANQREEV